MARGTFVSVFIAFMLVWAGGDVRVVIVLVNAVSGHRHDVPAALECFYQPQLLLWGNSGKNLGSIDSVPILVSRKRSKFSACDDCCPRAPLIDQIQLRCDGRGCRSVVAGDHLHFDAGVVAGLNSGGRGRSGRVAHGLQPGQDHSP